MNWTVGILIVAYSNGGRNVITVSSNSRNKRISTDGGVTVCVLLGNEALTSVALIKPISRAHSINGPPIYTDAGGDDGFVSEDGKNGIDGKASRIRATYDTGAGVVVDDDDDNEEDDEGTNDCFTFVFVAVVDEGPVLWWC